MIRLWVGSRGADWREIDFRINESTLIYALNNDAFEVVQQTSSEVGIRRERGFAD